MKWYRQWKARRACRRRLRKLRAFMDKEGWTETR